eukprot:scaffold1833_cov185-Ochromonas_danica.AAC.4
MEDELWHNLLLGAIIGAIPTISMSMMSLFVFKLDVPKWFEAMAQNFCAGLIIGAVGKELLPQFSSFSKFDVLIGLTADNDNVGSNQHHHIHQHVHSQSGKHSATKKPANEKTALINGSSAKYQSSSSVDTIDSDAEDGENMDIEHPILLLGSQVIASPAERSNVCEKVGQLMKLIQDMQSKAQALFTPSTSLTTAEAEILADQIDEEIHKLHYQLDHSRRLLQGSGSSMKGVVPRIWITEKGKVALHKGLDELHEYATRLSRYLCEEDLSKSALIAMHDTMGSMEDQISRLHNTVENYSLKWGRGLKKRVIPIPSTGSYIPLDLLVPVTIDCIVDGFLLGTTASFSSRAGFILGAANCIEMGFLGLAVSVRIQKCTASSLFSRYMALLVPPLIMLGSAIFGSYTGSLAQERPIAYVTFISFGIVALLYLALNELLAEARETVKGEETWYTGLVVFGGIYVVLIMDLFLP